MITACEIWQSTRRPRALLPGEVHLWRASLEATAELRRLLSSTEWIRAERHHLDRDRERFIAARGLLRSILGRYLSLDPKELTFSIGENGKPELANVCSPLRFNLSHSEDLMLLAITHSREIGVDLEAVRNDVPFEMLADYYFDPEDAWDLRLLPAAQRAWKFYDVWTCTEAQLKASGAGLTRGPTVAEPDRWSLLKFNPAEGYTGAVAIEGSEFQLECWSWRN